MNRARRNQHVTVTWLLPVRISVTMISNTPKNVPVIYRLEKSEGIN